jgi:hypothetical protein
MGFLPPQPIPTGDMSCIPPQKIFPSNRPSTQATPSSGSDPMEANPRKTPPPPLFHQLTLPTSPQGPEPTTSTPSSTTGPTKTA